MSFYLDHPAEVAATFGAASRPHQVKTGNRIVTLAANRPSTLRFTLGSGEQNVSVPVNWNAAAGAPPLQSVVARSGGKTIRVF